MLRRLQAYLRQVGYRMARRPALFCGAVALSCLFILAVKLSVSRARDVIVAARRPVRFFPTEAQLVDLYLGQVEQVEHLRAQADVTVVFYYAPWCGHSIAARSELQQVALQLATEVQFVAVNCWWNQGKCRRQKNFFQYPSIHLYYRRFGPIDYKGPLRAEYVEAFILRLITPLSYLPSQAALRQFLSHHQPSVIGFFEFNASPQPPGYITFLTSALLAFRRDSQTALRFGVVTNKKVAEAISVREDEAVYLHRHFNHSLLFPRKEINFTSESICSWVFQHTETLLQWLQPNGAKSHTLEEELNKGPALLVFLPHNPLAAKQELLSEVADVAVRYHSCCGSYLGAVKRHSADQLPHAGSVLSGTVPSGSTPVGSLSCNSLLLPKWSSMTQSSPGVCDLCLNHSRTRGPSSAPGSGSVFGSGCSLVELGWVLELYQRRVSVVGQAAPFCSNVLISYSPFCLLSTCCRLLGTSDTQNQPKTPPDHQNQPTHPLNPQDQSILDPTMLVPHCPLAKGLEGLHCRGNKTLRFYLLDSRLHWPLARRLGAMDNGSVSVFTAIVDLRDESHYVLKNIGNLTYSLEHFIKNYSAPYSPLQRHLVGDTRHQAPQSLIQEVTTQSFLSTVMDPERDVLVFYYTGWCGFCSVLYPMLLHVARLFQSSGTLTLARVNVANNDLPWEFMVDHVPTILFFPRRRKQLSVKFPVDTNITLPSLTQFILKHSGQSHLQTGLGAELRALQGEVLSLQQARLRLSKRLASLWQENRRLSRHTHTLESQNVELQEQFLQKSRELADARQRLLDLANASDRLLQENSLLKLLLSALNNTGREREEDGDAGRREEGDSEGDSEGEKQKETNQEAS